MNINLVRIISYLKNQKPMCHVCGHRHKPNKSCPYCTHGAIAW